MDVGRVLEACAESGTALELNAHTERLDINDTICRRAKDADVRVMIGTDAHRPEHFGLMALGIGTARRGWLGEIFEIQADMSHNYGGEAYQDYLGRFRGGILFNLGCHLIDFVVAVLGRPAKVVPFLKTAPGDPGGVVNHGLAVLEYPGALAAVRACSREVGSLPRRRLMKIGGLKGTVELCPLERFDGQPLRMRLTLAEPIPGYAAGAHTLDFGVVQDRYEDQLLELAREINGELESPWSCEHDCLVMFAVGGSVEEGHIGVSQCNQLLHVRIPLRQFRAVPAAEFLPPGRVMVEPSAQLRGRGGILEPLAVQVFLGHPAGPQPVDQHCPALRGGFAPPDVVQLDRPDQPLMPFTRRPSSRVTSRSSVRRLMS